VGEVIGAVVEVAMAGDGPVMGLVLIMAVATLCVLALRRRR